MDIAADLTDADREAFSRYEAEALALAVLQVDKDPKRILEAKRGGAADEDKTGIASSALYAIIAAPAQRDPKHRWLLQDYAWLRQALLGYNDPLDTKNRVDRFSLHRLLWATPMDLAQADHQHAAHWIAISLSEDCRFPWWSSWIGPVR